MEILPSQVIDPTLQADRANESYGRSAAVAEALRAEGVDFSFTTLGDPNYSGLFVLNHGESLDRAEGEPTMRLYRGVSALDASVLNQVPYALRAERYGDVTSQNPTSAMKAAVGAYLENPSFDNLMGYVGQLKSRLPDEKAIDTVDARVRKIENRILSGQSISESVREAHIDSFVGRSSADISPYIATTLSPENAERYGNGAVIVLDVPLSKIAGLGEQNEVLVSGEIPFQSISAIATKRSEFSLYGIKDIVHLLPKTPANNIEDAGTYLEQSAETLKPSVVDLISVSLKRSNQLLKATTPDVREAIDLPEDGPYSYTQLQEKLFNYYLLAMPELEGALYENTLTDKEYEFDLRTDVLDRKLEPYSRSKVTDGMLKELAHNYDRKLIQKQRRQARLGHSAVAAAAENS